MNNDETTPVDTILEQMLEPRPLPMGRTEFDEWSDRIIAGAMITAAVDTQKWSLANMLMHIGPTESHKPDAHFIHSLRVAAIKQAAHTIALEIREAGKARMAAEEPSKEG